MERSCMCCQESGEREAAVSLFCPKAKPGERKFRKVCSILIKSFVFRFCKSLIVSTQVSTKAPLECMCRPCSGVEETSIVPQEIASYADEGPLNNHFRKSQLQWDRTMRHYEFLIWFVWMYDWAEHYFWKIKIIIKKHSTIKSSKCLNIWLCGSYSMFTSTGK